MTRSFLLIAFLLLTAACAQPTEEAPGRVSPPPTAERLPGIAGAEQVIQETMAASNIPGIAAAIIRDGAVAWSKGFGLADVEGEIPMTVDSVMNVASISKTFVNAAVLQLVERGRIGLDDDVNRHLSFKVVHPKHPDTAITVRQLLTHMSSIADGPNYSDSYACDDPAVSLKTWIEGFLVEGGRYYNAEENFYAPAPGEQYHYSNVGYGLLGLLVEEVSGQPFPEYTRDNLFAPLGMNATSWMIEDLPPDTVQAVPHLFLEEGTPRTNELLAQRGYRKMTEDGYAALCLYSFYNYPDGLVRTSVHQLARFLLAHMGDGSYEDGRILSAETLALTWEAQGERNRLGEEEVQGLTWNGRERPGIGFLWGHTGGDPGVVTHMFFSPEDGVGVIVFANSEGGIAPITRSLFAAAGSLETG